jgi:phenylpropionate dioxygenase-like ring-hydroxylating dioxygenase large terminal subunit
VAGEPLIVVRGRDGVLRAFYNVCRHRGTAVVEEPCGRAVRFQCPYHAWIYDLDGSLIRAKHTDDLDDFSLAEYGLATVRGRAWQGFVYVTSIRRRRTSRHGWATCPNISTASTSRAARRRIRDVYEVDANWKFIAENYSECYHCPRHPSAAQPAHAI